jgi:hypothetical protein
MEVPLTIQVRLAKDIIPLAQTCQDNPKELAHLYSLCKVINECADDDHSVTYDLMEYVHECLLVAEGKGDTSWRDELLETLRDDLKYDD